MYIHKASCISAQKTFGQTDLDVLNPSTGGIMKAAEPAYENIPLNVLRRMGKAIRLSVGASVPLLKDQPLNGIIIGTANGGMEDCIKFLNQVMEYDEGTLTPTNFVQSTPNAIAAQIGLNTKNNNYNITHVHRGHAFENALQDAMMNAAIEPQASFLLGGVDEVSDYNYNIERLGGWYRKEPVSNGDLYTTRANGSLGGEGVAMFIVSGEKKNASTRVKAINFFCSNDEEEVANRLKLFLMKHASKATIDILLTGENGDQRQKSFYQLCEKELPSETLIARFKHFTGEFPTSTALALFIALKFIEQNNVPAHFVKSGIVNHEIGSVAIYNSYKGYQHSFILVEKV